MFKLVLQYGHRETHTCVSKLQRPFVLHCILVLLLGGAVEANFALVPVVTEGGAPEHTLLINMNHRVAPEPVRIARNGIAYTESQFMDYYGFCGKLEWDAARVRGGAKCDAMSSFSMPPPGPPAGEPPAHRELPPDPPAEDPVFYSDDDNGASEHVLLSLDDLPELRQHGTGRFGALHDEARAFIDKFASADHDCIGVLADLTLEWPNWRLYIASHKLAQELIGPGVKAFTVEFIDGTKDPNRGGRPRLDLVIRHSNNAYWRLHPGSTPKRDAKPKFFPASAPEPAAHEPASAPEPAAYEWRAPGGAGVFSSDRAKLVPQIDRLGKADIWQAVQRIPQALIPNMQSRAWLDITCGKHILWWLWICNLGNDTRFVIGAGVHAAHMAMNTNHEAVFKFTRIDETECVVKLACIPGGRLQVSV